MILITWGLKKFHNRLQSVHPTDFMQAGVIDCKLTHDKDTIGRYLADVRKYVRSIAKSDICGQNRQGQIFNSYEFGAFA